MWPYCTLTLSTLTAGQEKGSRVILTGMKASKATITYAVLWSNGSQFKTTMGVVNVDRATAFTGWVTPSGSCYGLCLKG